MSLSIPEWIIDPSKPTPGIDLLGLRIQAQRISNSLLDGITTVSPRIRYLSFRAWIINKYYSLEFPDDWDSFIEFVSKMEAAFVKGNLLVNPKETQLVGSDKAGNISSENGNWMLQRLVKQLAYLAYTGPSQQLLIDSTERPSGVPTLTKDRGLKLSEIIENTLKNTEFSKKLQTNRDISLLSEKDLVELGNTIKINELSDDERHLLVNLVIPFDPQTTMHHNELPRLKSYSLFLWISENINILLSDNEIYEFVKNIDNIVPDVLEETRLGWLLYFTSDMIAVVFEANLELIREVINNHFEPFKPIDSTLILNKILEDSTFIEQTLTDFNLLLEGDTLQNLMFNDFYNNFFNSLGNISNNNGINLWDSILNELEIISSAKSKDFHIPALLPICLLIIHFRFKDGMNNQFKKKILKTGFNEITYDNFILSKIEEWQLNNTPLVDIIAYLLDYVVEQHNHIIWSRLALDTKRNTSIIIKDNENWSTTKNYFQGGRTQSRLRQAIGWLNELSLINNSGITPSGKIVLQKRLELLENNISHES